MTSNDFPFLHQTPKYDRGRQTLEQIMVSMLRMKPMTMLEVTENLALHPREAEGLLVLLKDKYNVQYDHSGEELKVYIPPKEEATHNYD